MLVHSALGIFFIVSLICRSVCNKWTPPSVDLDAVAGLLAGHSNDQLFAWQWAAGQGSHGDKWKKLFWPLNSNYFLWAVEVSWSMCQQILRRWKCIDAGKVLCFMWHHPKMAVWCSQGSYEHGVLNTVASGLKRLGYRNCWSNEFLWAQREGKERDSQRLSLLLLWTNPRSCSNRC